MASEHVRGDMVKVSEFPYLAVKYHVHGVPHTVIKDTKNVVGGLPELKLARAVLKALGK